MKKTLALLLLCCSFGLYSQSIQDQIDQFSTELDYPFMERILHYHSDIRIKKNCQVLITEKIVVNVRGEDFRRGIYRDIPLSYEYQGGMYHVFFDIVSVKRDGHNEPFNVDHLSNGVRIYVGEESVNLNLGVHIFEITYLVDNVLMFYDKHDELFWNVNGNGWLHQMDSVSATVYYPKNAEYVQHSGFTGNYGSKGSDFIYEQNKESITFIVSKGLGSEECLSVAVGWKKNHLIYPNSWDKLVFFLLTYAVWFLGLLGILIGLTFNYLMWWKYGIDPKPGTIMPRFYPPEGLSPAECAYLNNEGRKTDTMFGSMLLVIASKGWIKITKVSEKQYHLTKLKSSAKKMKLTSLEEYFYSKLMAKDVVYLITDKYNPRISKTSDLLIEKIDKKQTGEYYVRNSFLKMRQYIFPVITLLLGILGFLMWGGPVFAIIISVLIHFGLNWIFGRLYEQPTKKGRQVMDEIQGFIMYMKYANKERIKLMNPPSMDFQHFEENLSYAVALGVTKEWAGQFDQETLREANSGGMSYMDGFTFYYVAHFSAFGSELSSAISSAQTPPVSSGGSGGGYSGGGGGFSGGGFGGGGGGGW